jgi:hypothetical protein
MNPVISNHLRYMIAMPKPSGWACYLFGNRPGLNGMVWYPAEDAVPNAFVRFCMRVCLGCTWVYEPEHKSDP